MSLVDLGKRLLEAAKRGDTEEVRSLMANGAPFTTDWLGNSPLHFSALSGHISTAEVLLRAGISRDARTKVDRTPLHVAAQEGHLDIVELLLRNSADIEAKDMLKMTPLHWAVEKAHIPVIQLLSKNGADIHCPNKFDRSPLDISIYNGRTDIAQLLQLTSSGQNVQIIETSEVMSAEEEVATETIISSQSMPNSPEVITMPKFSAVATDGTDQSSTSVLATLAALAEATGPLNTHATSTTAAETLKWLQGITISTGESPTVITSALESGQTISLTEAGKLALKLAQHGEEEEVHTVEGDLVHETVVDSAIETVVGDSNQKVITIVADENQLVTEDGETPILVTMAAGDAGIDTADEPPSKRARLEETIVETVVVANDHDWLEDKDEDGQDDLRRQLEEVQKQAEEYRQQLKVKELEAEEYKQQLNEIGAKSQK